MDTDYRSIFESILSDPRYLANLDYGDPRSGHPEGSVRAHVAELEANVEALRSHLTSEDEYWKLKVLVHTHDTFKAESRPGVPIKDPGSHASLARAFLAGYCDDPDLLAIVQYHDEPYALFRQFESKGSYNKERMEVLRNEIKDWDLFLMFLIVDGCTAGKSREPLHWLFREIGEGVQARFTSADILP
jgi:hypothetical protein